MHSIKLTPGQASVIETEELLNPMIYGAHDEPVNSKRGWLAFSVICPTGKSVRRGEDPNVYALASDWIADLRELKAESRRAGVREAAIDEDRFAGISHAIDLAAEENTDVLTP